MSRATNSTGLFNEGRSNLKVRRTDGRPVAGGLLVQIPGKGKVERERTGTHFSTANKPAVIFCTGVEKGLGQLGSFLGNCDSLL